MLTLSLSLSLSLSSTRFDLSTIHSFHSSFTFFSFFLFTSTFLRFSFFLPSFLPSFRPFITNFRFASGIAIVFFSTFDVIKRQKEQSGNKISLRKVYTSIQPSTFFPQDQFFPVVSFSSFSSFSSYTPRG